MRIYVCTYAYVKFSSLLQYHVTPTRYVGNDSFNKTKTVHIISYQIFIKNTMMETTIPCLLRR